MLEENRKVYLPVIVIHVDHEAIFKSSRERCIYVFFGKINFPKRNHPFSLVSYRIYILFAKLNFPQGIAIFPLVPQVSNHSVIYDRGSKFVKNFQHLLMGLEMVRENRDDVYYRNEPKRKYGKGTARKAG